MLEESLHRTLLTSFKMTTCLGVFVFVVATYFANDYANKVQKAVHMYRKSVLYGKQWESYSCSALFIYIKTTCNKQTESPLCCPSSPATTLQKHNSIHPTVLLNLFLHNFNPLQKQT